MIEKLVDVGDKEGEIRRESTTFRLSRSTSKRVPTQTPLSLCSLTVTYLFFRVRWHAMAGFKERLTQCPVT